MILTQTLWAFCSCPNTLCILRHAYLPRFVSPPNREQRVEIALGPKGAFDNGNIGALMRRVSGDRTVSAVLQVRGNPKPPREPQTPRVAELLHKAIEWRRQLDTGEVRNQADIARREGVTRARVTQVLGLLRLAPEIQDQLVP